MPPSPQDFATPRWTWLPLPRGQRAEPVARQWLAARLGIVPQSLVIQRDAHGRPRMDVGHPGWDCNWSHSGNGLAVALGHGIQVGIDLEWPRPRPRVAELAERFFARREAQWIRSMPVDRREHAFLRLWCAKEAVLKAHGRGLAFGLERAVFEDTPDGLRLQACDPALGRPGDWQLSELAPEPGYLGAMAWRPSPATGDGGHTSRP